jgi:zinc transport system substrate-binding protein
VSVIALLALLTGACSASSAGDGEPKTSVAAGFYPLAEAARRIGGSVVDVQNLTPPGVEPHDLELTPNEIARIQEADVVLYLGGGFAPAIEQAVADARGVTADLLEGFSVAEAVGGQSEEEVDPHVWLDPVLYRQLVERVRRTLSRARPGEASTFRTNANSFDAELRHLDRDYQAGLAGCTRHVIVTSHAAFGYLARRYGLTQEPIAGLSPDAEPSPARLAELADLVRRDGVTTIFTEELVSPRVAETLATEVGVTTEVLNPIEGLTAAEVVAGADYQSVMRDNLRTLRLALDCPAA